jgi:hypothetical protein
MQCDNAMVHCKAFVGNHSLSQLLSSQSEYSTHSEKILYFYDFILESNVIFA